MAALRLAKGIGPMKPGCLRGQRATEASGRADLIPAIRRILMRLPIEDRLILALHYGAGLTHDEIGRELGIAKWIVATRLRLILRSMRGRLSRKGFSEAGRALTAAQLEEAILTGDEPPPALRDRILAIAFGKDSGRGAD